MEDSNLGILKRLLEIAKNPLDWSVYPKSYKEEHLFLANVINDSIRVHEREFAEAFQQAVGSYKQSLEKGAGYGWFHEPEKLVWINTQLNQLKYAVYGERFVHEIRFNEGLSKAAYKDLIEQIDRTALMTEEQLMQHRAECNKLSQEIVDEMLKEIEKEKKPPL